LILNAAHAPKKAKASKHVAANVSHNDDHLHNDDVEDESADNNDDDNDEDDTNSAEFGGHAGIDEAGKVDATAAHAQTTARRKRKAPVGASPAARKRKS
jgi:hypothetical protein